MTVPTNIVETYKSDHQAVISQHGLIENPSKIFEQFTDLADKLVIDLTKAAIETASNKRELPPFAIYAIGGFGRCEMYPYSDLDLMFVVPSADNPFAELLAETMLYPLWDGGLKVGYSIRSPQDVLQQVRDDVSAWTAVLDRRLLYSHADMPDKLEQTIHSAYHGKLVQQRTQDKWQELTSRHKSQSNTVFVLEPNVKEGVGALRDIHTLAWVANLDDTRDDWVDRLAKQLHWTLEQSCRLRDAAVFMQRLRLALHFSVGKLEDKLLLQTQDSVAEVMGVEESAVATKSETLMGLYYDHARVVNNLANWVRNEMVRIPRHRLALYKVQERTVDAWFRSSAGQLWFRVDVDINEQPAVVLQILQSAAERNLSLKSDALQIVLQAMRRRKIVSSKPIRAAFLAWFNSPHCSKILALAHRLGVLPLLSREFNHIYCRLQHDAVHSYTTDVHLINCLGAFEDHSPQWLDFPPQVKEAYDQIENLQLMRLAIFLHDIGKGYGKNHSTFGADLVRSMFRRFGYPSDASLRVQLLIREHLTMSHTAQKTDISDPETVRKFCESVGDRQNLAMLYILTLCDQMGVASNLLNSWKVNLYTTLYERADHMLATGDTKGRWLTTELRAKRKKVIQRLRDTPGQFDTIGRFPPRYFLHFDVEAIVDHAQFLSSKDENGVAIRMRQRDDGLIELWIAGPDAPGILANICASIFQASLSIVNTDAFVPKLDAELFNIFIVDSTDEFFFEDQRKRKRLEDGIREALDGENIEVVTKEREIERIRTFSEVSSRKDVIKWNNAVSETDTVIEVQTWDRLGLLYRIAKHIFDAGFTLATARIDTHGARANDIFYIRDNKRRKIFEFEKLDELVETIRADLASDLVIEKEQPA